MKAHTVDDYKTTISVDNCSEFIIDKECSHDYIIH